ncbi:MAG: zinc ABC transporter substrate-binding protein [Desulfobacterales bacterium]|nr:zinc ABC transporter substrate-binding protein [Desulfobacterales bacterium]MDD4072230.1 zinc ABC transporter substrate-binding protein [Desulfobacterales bacterium]MDD4393687.1 zinc ABC transporter substrate-binding protein [Desulfobacterales bacterium]
MLRLALRSLAAWITFTALFLPSAQAQKPVSVFVSIAPQQYIVKKIGGNRVTISAMVEPGANPAVYEPRPAQLTGLAGADMYVAVGVPFERTWLKRFSAINPGMLIIFTDADINKKAMVSHRHEDTQPLIEADLKDPHIWLSPPLVMLQSRIILNGLLRVDPGSSRLYRDNYRQWMLELIELDDKLITLFQGIGNRTRFMVFHPAWGYFARAYGLNQIPVEIEGKEPKISQLHDFIQLAKQYGLTVIFAQPQFSSKNAQVIANGINGKVDFIDPLSPDWKENLLRVAEKIKTSLSGPVK